MKSVFYHFGEHTSEEDKLTYFSSKTCPHVVIIEYKWFEVMQNTTLYLYEFDASEFKLLDENAGYFISKKKQIPVNKFEVVNIFAELFRRNVELRLVDNLWDISREIQETTLHWSLCKMNFAK